MIHRSFPRNFRVAIKQNPKYLLRQHCSLYFHRKKFGLELTGVLAQIFMVWWDREFKTRVETLSIPLYMYKRYVDDINVIVGAVEPGAKIAWGCSL